VKFPYPNRAQWIIIWVAAILLFTQADWDFFKSFGEYGPYGNWLWPEQAFGHRYQRLPVTLIVLAVLLVGNLPGPSLCGPRS
jgi:hypothetical protein